jgi:hypothetical protein
VPGLDEHDFALEEFKALRSEIASIRQIETAVYTAALTILSAVGGFALGKGGRLDILLVLPLVLSGLGLIIVECQLGVANIGEYIRENLVKRLPVQGDWTWEKFIHKRRNKVYLGLGACAPAMILFAPSVAALGIAYHPTDHLWPLWWADFVATALFVLTPPVMVWLRKPKDTDS